MDTGNYQRRLNSQLLFSTCHQTVSHKFFEENENNRQQQQQQQKKAVTDVKMLSQRLNALMFRGKRY